MDKTDPRKEKNPMHQESKKRPTEDEMAEQLTSDKAQITKIAKRMIAEHNHYTEDEEIDDHILLRSTNAEGSKPV